MEHGKMERQDSGKLYEEFQTLVRAASLHEMVESEQSGAGHNEQDAAANEEGDLVKDLVEEKETQDSKLPSPQSRGRQGSFFSLATGNKFTFRGFGTRETHDEDSGELERLLADSELRNRLADELVLDESGITAKLNFFAAAMEALRESNMKLRKHKKQAIVKVFFQSKVVQVNGLPPGVVTDVIALKTEALGKACQMVAASIAKHPVIMNALDLL
jgi:hypothetical protein